MAADWVEAALIFGEGQLSSNQVIDILIEQNIYKPDSQDFCSGFVENIFTELERRSSGYGNYAPYNRRYGVLSTDHDWQRNSVHAFLVAVSIGPEYEDWEVDYNEQGSLFEGVVKESVDAQLPTWRIATTAATPQTPRRLSDVINEVATSASEAVSESANQVVNLDGNEAGLDQYCIRQWPDLRGGYPLLLMQCASGRNWARDKLNEPNLHTWNSVINWKWLPSRSIAIPFVLSDSEFSRRTSQYNGLLLDRIRLLAAFNSADLWPTHLADQLEQWLEPIARWFQSKSLDL
jgi:hypothetical protein